MMLAIFSKNPSLLRGLGPSAPQEFPIAIRSVVSLYGILDRRTWLDNRFPGAPLMLECYGGKAVFEERVPAEKAITPMDLEFDAYPPTFLAVGSKDRLSNSTRVLGRRLSGMRGVSRCEVYPEEIHGFFNMHWRPGYQGLRQDIFDFFSAHDTEARSQTDTPHAEVTA
jgi:acetyl esterase/lipase